MGYNTHLMKLLVIGFGKMGMLHAATLRTLPGVTGVVIAETSPLVRRAIGTLAPGMRVVADYRAALAAGDIAGAVIATPTASHAPIFRELGPRVRGIFVEKPFASDFADASAAAAALPAEKTGSVMTGHCLRFSPVFEEAKRLLDAGVLKGITRFEASMFSSDVLKPSGSWRFKGARSGGGVLLDLGSHLVDMVRHFFGPPARLSGRTESVVSKAAEDSFVSEWFYPASGFTGTLIGSWSKPDSRKASLQIRVEGPNGRMDVFDDAVELELGSAAAGIPAGSSRFAVTSLEHAVPFDLAGPMYTRQLLAWLASFSGPPVAVNTLTENLTNLQLIDAIRNSKGKTVEFESVWPHDQFNGRANGQSGGRHASI